MADVGDDSGIPGAFSGKSGQNEEEEGSVDNPDFIAPERNC